MRPNGRYTERPSPFAELIEKDRAFRERRSGLGQGGGVSQSGESQSAARSGQAREGGGRVSPPQKYPSSTVQANPQYTARAKIKKIYLRVPKIDSPEAKKAKNLIEIFDGETPVSFYDTETKGYTDFEVSLDATPFVIGELKKLLGDENVAIK